jgi:hypothetical protein
MEKINNNYKKLFFFQFNLIFIFQQLISNMQTTRCSKMQTTRCSNIKICKGILVIPHDSIPHTLREIPIRYWFVKPATPDNTSKWQPSICEKNIITDYRGLQFQFRIHNKAKYGKFLPEEFKQLCIGPSEVLCTGILTDWTRTYYPFEMIFSDKPEWKFYMATDACCQPIDYIVSIESIIP